MNHLIAGVQFTGKIGVGTIVAIVVAVATGVTVYWRTKLMSPSDFQNAYRAERELRVETEQKLASALTELVTLRAATDISIVIEQLERFEERLTRRLEAGERNQAKTLELLTGLVDRLARTA